MGRQRIHSALGASCLLILAQVAACGGDSGGSPIITAGASAATGTSGTGTGTAGTVGATAGTVAATAGTTAYAGTGATAGMPAAGSAAGAGAAGGGAADMYTSCATADKTTPGAMLRDAAGKAIIVMPGSCAFSSCHDSGAKKAKLILDTSAGTDLHALVTDKPSCESPNLKIVDSSGGDAALAKSWLWQKLIAPATADGTLTTKPEWGAPGNCGQTVTGTFGLRMPFSNSPALLEPASKLIAIRDWICAGAP